MSIRDDDDPEAGPEYGKTKQEAIERLEERSEQEKRSKIAHLVEKVMGWKPAKQEKVGRGWNSPRAYWIDSEGRHARFADRSEKFDPFASIADAMELLDTWESGEPDRTSVIFTDSHYRRCSVKLREGTNHWIAECPDRKTAICNCLLEATGWKERINE